jgi:hypothetical protein
MPPARGIRVSHTYLTYPPKNEIYHNLWYAPWLPFLYSVYSKEFPFSQEMIHMQLILKISEAYCGGGPGWCTYLTVSPNICKLFLKVMVEHILTIWDVILIDWLAPSKDTSPICRHGIFWQMLSPEFFGLEPNEHQDYLGYPTFPPNDIGPYNDWCWIPRGRNYNSRLLLWMEEILDQSMVYPLIIPFFAVVHSYQYIYANWYRIPSIHSMTHAKSAQEWRDCVGGSAKMACSLASHFRAISLRWENSPL